MAPTYMPKPPPLKSSTLWCTSLKLVPTVRCVPKPFASENRYAVSPSLKVPSGLFSSFVRWNWPELSDTIEMPRLGSRLPRSEEHTSELQSLTNLVCRLLLEKKKHTMEANQMQAGARRHGVLGL